MHSWVFRNRERLEAIYNVVSAASASVDPARDRGESLRAGELPPERVRVLVPAPRRNKSRTER